MLVGRMCRLRSQDLHAMTLKPCVCMQVPRSRMQQIDRVQNLRLWTKYLIRRSEA
jgi:hypothetical protein